MDSYSPATTLEPLAKIRAHVQSAIDKLANKDGAGAQKILVNIVNPWFYQSAPQNSTDLTNAQAHTTARWYSEEASRLIDAKKLAQASRLLQDNVLPRLDSSSSGEMGILGVKPASKQRVVKKTAKKKPAAKKSSTKSKK